MDIKVNGEYGDKIILQRAREIFLELYPSGTDIVLLENTIEGAVGMDWKIIDIPQYFVEEVKAHYITELKRQKLLRSYPGSICRICRRPFMYVLGVEKSEAAAAADELLAMGWAIEENRSLCPLCDGDLKTDSDYKFVFLDTMTPAAQWYDPSEH